MNKTQTEKEKEKESLRLFIAEKFNIFSKMKYELDKEDLDYVYFLDRMLLIYDDSDLKIVCKELKNEYLRDIRKQKIKNFLENN